MSSDKTDKTVFRQSGGNAGDKSDHTIIRPTPGRRGSGQTQLPRSSEQTRVQRAPEQHAQRASHATHADTYAGQFRTIYGLNPLVNAAATLIAVFHKTRQSVTHSNVGGLHQQLAGALRSFEATAKEKNIRPEVVLAARYILCAALDEAVLNTPWGAESAWTQRTLLSMFHNETHGGEKFFLLLDKMRERPAENLEILELMYILLSLGFEGKYRVLARGRDAIEQIRDELFRVIRLQRGDFERALSPTWRGLGNAKKTLANYVPMWVIASFVGGILLLSYSGFRYWLYQSTEHVAVQLNAISAAETGNKPSLR